MIDPYIRAKKILYTHNFLTCGTSPYATLAQIHLDALFESTLGLQQASRCQSQLDAAAHWPASQYLQLLQAVFAKHRTRSLVVAGRGRGAFARNLRLLARLLHLDDGETTLVELLVLVSLDDMWARGLGLSTRHHLYTYALFLSLVASLLELPLRTVQRMLAPRATLLASGLVQMAPAGETAFRSQFDVLPEVQQALSGPVCTEARLLAGLCHQSPAPTITKAEVPTYHTDLADVTTLLQTALLQRRAGVNVLLYGPPGGGETELARLIARLCRAHLYEIPSSREDGSPTTPRHRVCALVLAQRVLSHHQHALLLVDDADEIWHHGGSLLAGDHREFLSKDWLNRTLEGNAVPTIWIVNRYQGIEEAYKRRFTTSIRFTPPGPALRKRLWHTVLRRRRVGLPLSEEMLETLAQRYEVSVGLIDKAVETATLIHGPQPLALATIERLLERAILLRDNGQRLGQVPTQEETPFDLALLHTAPSALDIVHGIQTVATRRVPSLCLLFYGLPGSGKTAFVYYIARLLKRPLLHKRASELLSPFVGGTEHNLAESFRQARQEHALLFIDEGDSFLYERARAQQSWQVSQVNELLTQIDAFTEGILILATNMPEVLDPASLRRFVKVQFLPLTLAQRVQAFTQYCRPLLSSKTLADATLADALCDLDTLTLGDLQVVRHQQLFHPGPCTVERLVIRMAEENAIWGYRRIQGALTNLGYPIDAITIRNILRRHHLEPASQRRQTGMRWAQCLKMPWEVLAATDFFTGEVATWQGLMTYYVLVVMDVATRCVHSAGITPHPTAAFMQQCARQLTDPFEGFLLGKRYLIHDRHTKYTQAFDALMKASEVEPVLLPPRSPNPNAYCERCVRSIKEEALGQMVMLGERALYYAIQQYLAHYHHERNHQGLDNQLIAQEEAVDGQTGHVVRRERLGALLSYYHRKAA